MDSTFKTRSRSDIYDFIAHASTPIQESLRKEVGKVKRGDPRLHTHGAAAAAFLQESEADMPSTSLGTDHRVSTNCEVLCTDPIEDDLCENSFMRAPSKESLMTELAIS